MSEPTTPGPEAVVIVSDAPFELVLEESNLVKHARTELEREFGPNGGDDPYDGMITKAVLELIATFDKQGHSGMSAGLTLHIFEKLAKFEALSPLTDDPNEWHKHHDDLWQSRRSSANFSNDGGKTYWNVDEAGHPVHTSVPKGTTHTSDSPR